MLRKSLILYLFILLFLACTQEEILLPEGQTISHHSAVMDIHYNTQFYWLVYGDSISISCEEEIRKKYSLEVYLIGGCVITNKLKKQIEEYNSVIDGYMTQVYDLYWKEKLLVEDIDCSNIRLDGDL